MKRVFYCINTILTYIAHVACMLNLFVSYKNIRRTWYCLSEYIKFDRVLHICFRYWPESTNWWYCHTFKVHTPPPKWNTQINTQMFHYLTIYDTWPLHLWHLSYNDVNHFNYNDVKHFSFVHHTFFALCQLWRQNFMEPLPVMAGK